MDRLKKCSASSTKLSVESPLSTVVVQSPLNSGRDPFAKRTFDGVDLSVADFLDGETGAEHRLVDIGGEWNGY